MTAGRPPDNSPNKSIRVKAWFYYVATSLRLKHTGYALETYLEQDKVRKSDEGTIRPCKYDGYKKGLHLPRPALIDQVEILAPGSKSLINHPFWDITNPINDITELYIHLNKLRPEVRDLLFFPGTDPGKIPIRNRRDYIETVETLSKIADLDALSALIGLHHEDYLIEAFGPPALYIFYLRPLLTTFRRLIYHPPFPHIAHELFKYLTTSFFIELKNDFALGELADMDVNRAIHHSCFLISLVDDLEILKRFKTPPVSCMHIVERYMTENTLMLAIKYKSEKDWHILRNLRDIRNLTKTLRRWELKQSNLSSIPWS